MAKYTALGAEKSKKRTPPKPYSEDTLLSAMETAGNQEFDEETEKKGLGTPATRASIIEKLVSSGYAVRKGKQLFATQDGADLISVLPEYLRSAAMTAEWENRLLRIEKGELCGQEFLEGIVELIDRMLLECGKYPWKNRTVFIPGRALEPARCAEAPSMRVSGISSVGTGSAGFPSGKRTGICPG